MTSTLVAERPTETRPRPPVVRTAPPSRQPRWQRLIVLAALGYEAIGALSGGALLVAAPDGHLMDMPVDAMRGFFPDFYVPGLILLGLGVLNCIAFIAVWRRTPTDWLFAGLALGGLTVWFSVEIIVLGQLHWLHVMWGLPVLVGTCMALPLIPSRTERIPFIKVHPVLTYYVLTFLISWGGVLMVAGGPSGIPATAEQFSRLIPFAILAMYAGPPIASLVMTGLAGGRMGYRDLLGRLTRWRVGARWYAVALLTAPVVFLVVLLPLSLVSANFLPIIFTTGDRGTLLLTGILPAVLVGICEELGWTGFAIPELRRRHSVLATGLVVGVLWGAWHVLALAFWAAGVTAGDMPIAVFVTIRVLDLLVGQLLAYRLLMVWVYDHTQSVLLAALMHTGLLAATWVLSPTAATGVPMFVYGIGVGVGFWVIVAILGLAGGHLARTSPRAQSA